ncbi:MAG: M24 family metallopeptidase [Candidatus Heimdallarchaeota archaeon]
MINEKLNRLQNLMRSSKIDTIIIPLGVNFRWLFGVKDVPSERLLVSIIESEGSPQFLVPTFEIDRIKKMTKAVEVIGWEETENPFLKLASEVVPDKVKTIGIEPKMWFSVYQSISTHLQAKKFVDTESLFSNLRSVKDDEEIKNLRKASQKSADTIIKTLADLETGITEGNLQSLLKDRLIWGSGEEMFNLVQFGDNSSLPHYHGGERKLKKNDVVLIDAGGTVNNYWGDITITTVFGEATEKFKEIFKIVYNANQSGKEAAEQGKTPHEIDMTTRQIITKKGYGEYFTHRTGHGLGLEVHENPYIVNGNHKPLKAGNSFTVEPGIYLPGKFGIRIEDNVIKMTEGILSSKIQRFELLEV